MPSVWRKPQILGSILLFAALSAWLAFEFTPRSHTNLDGLIRDIEAIAERACACKDADCARSSLRDFGKLAAGANRHADISKEDRDRLTAAGHKFGLCLQSAGVPQAEIRAVAESAAR